MLLKIISATKPFNCVYTSFIETKCTDSRSTCYFVINSVLLFVITLTLSSPLVQCPLFVRHTPWQGNKQVSLSCIASSRNRSPCPRTKVPGRTKIISFHMMKHTIRAFITSSADIIKLYVSHAVHGPVLLRPNRARESLVSLIKNLTPKRKTGKPCISQSGRQSEINMFKLSSLGTF